MDLTGTFRIFCPTAIECTFFSAAYRIFSKVDDILGQNETLKSTKNLNNLLHLNIS
jgi:hypothetical protein